MKVMVIVKATRDSEAGVMPSQELLTAMGNFNEELVSAGIMLAGEGLHPSSKGARVVFSGKNRTVVDGPFAETKELIAGFWIWRVKSLQEAIDWAKRCPNPHDEDCHLEIRPVFSAEDFGAEFTPELREQEASVLAQTLGLAAPRFEDMRELKLAGLNASYDMETRSQIPAQWCKFVSHLGKIPGQVDGMTYGVSWNCTGGGRFNYLAGVEVNDGTKLPADFTMVPIPAGRYAIFTHGKHVSELPKTIDTIFEKWVPDCGLKVASGRCLERYTPEFNGQTGMGGMEVWIPLEAT
jgi:AraC family transcriptional regulator